MAADRSSLEISELGKRIHNLLIDKKDPNDKLDNLLFGHANYDQLAANKEYLVYMALAVNRYIKTSLLPEYKQYVGESVEIPIANRNDDGFFAWLNPIEIEPLANDYRHFINELKAFLGDLRKKRQTHFERVYSEALSRVTALPASAETVEIVSKFAANYEKVIKTENLEEFQKLIQEMNNAAIIKKPHGVSTTTTTTVTTPALDEAKEVKEPSTTSTASSSASTSTTPTTTLRTTLAVSAAITPIDPSSDLILNKFIAQHNKRMTDECARVLNPDDRTSLISRINAFNFAINAALKEGKSNDALDFYPEFYSFQKRVTTLVNISLAFEERSVKVSDKVTVVSTATPITASSGETKTTPPLSMTTAPITSDTKEDLGKPFADAKLVAECARDLPEVIRRHLAEEKIEDSKPIEKMLSNNTFLGGLVSKDSTTEISKAWVQAVHDYVKVHLFPEYQRYMPEAHSAVAAAYQAILEKPTFIKQNKKSTPSISRYNKFAEDLTVFLRDLRIKRKAYLEKAYQDISNRIRSYSPSVQEEIIKEWPALIRAKTSQQLEEFERQIRAINRLLGSEADNTMDTSESKESPSPTTTTLSTTTTTTTSTASTSAPEEKLPEDIIPVSVPASSSDVDKRSCINTHNRFLEEHYKGTQYVQAINRFNRFLEKHLESLPLLNIQRLTSQFRNLLKLKKDQKNRISIFLEDIKHTYSQTTSELNSTASSTTASTSTYATPTSSTTPPVTHTATATTSSSTLSTTTGDPAAIASATLLPRSVTPSPVTITAPTPTALPTAISASSSSSSALPGIKELLAVSDEKFEESLKSKFHNASREFVKEVCLYCRDVLLPEYKAERSGPEATFNSFLAILDAPDWTTQTEEARQGIFTMALMVTEKFLRDIRKSKMPIAPPTTPVTSVNASTGATVSPSTATYSASSSSSSSDTKRVATGVHSTGTPVESKDPAVAHSTTARLQKMHDHPTSTPGDSKRGSPTLPSDDWTEESIQNIKKEHNELMKKILKSHPKSKELEDEFTQLIHQYKGRLSNKIIGLRTAEFYHIVVEYKYSPQLHSKLSEYISVFRAKLATSSKVSPAPVTTPSVESKAITTTTTTVTPTTTPLGKKRRPPRPQFFHVVGPYSSNALSRKGQSHRQG